MAATAARDAKRKEGLRVSYQLPATGSTVYKGTLTSVRIADGCAYPARSGTSTDIFVGVAEETKSSNGTGGGSFAGAGGVSVHVLKTGVYSFIGSGFAQTDVGAQVYASDDQTVTKTATNNQFVGYVEEVISATEVLVRIDRAVC